MLVSKNDCITISGLNFYSVADMTDEERPRRVTIRMKKEDADRFISLINEYKKNNFSALEKIDYTYHNDLRRFKHYEENGYIVFPIAIPRAVTVAGLKNSPTRTIELLHKTKKDIQDITCDIVFEEDDAESGFYLILDIVVYKYVKAVGVMFNSPYFKWNKEITLEEVPFEVIEVLKNRTECSIDELLAMALDKGVLLCELDAKKVLKLMNIEVSEKENE